MSFVLCQGSLNAELVLGSGVKEQEGSLPIQLIPAEVVDKGWFC
jgi:hypothetical protein